MRMLHSLEEACGQFGHPVVTVGNFDGVHLGHNAIIQETVKRAGITKSSCLIITFEPHPQLVIGYHSDFKIITSLETKLRLFQQFPIDAVLILPFTRAFAAVDSEVYMQTVYCDCLQVREVIVGYSHAFGKFGRGNADQLRSFGEKHRFDVSVIPPLKVDSNIINSSRIRSLIQNNRIKEAVSLLGHPYTITGRVIRGEGRGRQLKFPTANIEIPAPGLLMPNRGVYAVWAVIDDQRMAGVMNIGIRPTFGADRETCEVHIFDFSGDLYEREVSIEVIERIRDEQRFESVEALKSQISADVRHTRRILSLST